MPKRNPFAIEQYASMYGITEGKRQWRAHWGHRNVRFRVVEKTAWYELRVFPTQEAIDRHARFGR